MAIDYKEWEVLKDFEKRIRKLEKNAVLSIKDVKFFAEEMIVMKKQVIEAVQVVKESYKQTFEIKRTLEIYLNNIQRMTGDE